MKIIAKIILIPLKIIGIVLSLALILSILSNYISPGANKFLPFFGLMFQIIFAANVVALVLWLLIKQRAMIIIQIAVIFVACFYVPRFFQFFGKTSNDYYLKIITYNIHNFYLGDKRSETSTDIANYLQKQNADVVCLQEYYMNPTFRKQHPPIDEILSKYKYSFDNLKGMGILSKYPITKTELLWGGAYVISATIEKDNTPIKIYCCHLESNSFSPEKSKKEMSDNKKRDDEVRRVGKTLHKSFINRSTEADSIAADIARTSCPVIVCGDFNDTPMSYTYQTIRGNLKDSYIEAGSGWCNTFRGLMSLLRIDYVFVPEKFKVVESIIDKNMKKSDHFPVIVKLKIKN